MKVRDIMTIHPQAVTAEEPVARAAQIMEDLDVGFVPVVDSLESMRLRGVITDRDIAIRHVAHGDRANCRVADHMTATGIETIHADADVRDVVGRMSHDRVRRLPVVEEGDRLIGIVAQADVAVRYGPTDPKRVEEMLAQVSAPARPHR
jgi:CBS domain-containing protein